MNHNEVRGCLIGGAVGDALGAPVEFSSWSSIKKKYGEIGVTELEMSHGVYGAVTDDTQMTLFTAEGLIRAHNRWLGRGICNPVAVIHNAYGRWLRTQGEDNHKCFNNGWLITNKQLWNRRAPGTTCIDALLRMNGLAQPASNDSKGCGTVMRAAPIGLFALDAFTLGQQCSALTHGHPTGQIAGGAFAHLIQLLAHKHELRQAVMMTLEKTEQKERAFGFESETSTAIMGAWEAWDRGVYPDARAIASLGDGWVAEEALAISIYCALSADTFEGGVISAVNHSGDSDSTGAITGNILGLMYGYESIPKRWRETVELADIVSAVAQDLAGGIGATEERYPGN